MKFKDIFETKKSSTDNFYRHTVRMNGGESPQYTQTRFRTLADEGYCKNWVIYRCLQEIINAAIQLDWVVMRYNKDGKSEEIPNHPAQQIMEKPNPVTTQSDFLKKAILYYFIGGDVPFVRTTVRNNKKVQHIDAFRPDYISFDLTGDVDMPYKNIYYKGQKSQDIDPQDFLLWKNFNPLDEFSGTGRGLSPFKPISRNGDLLSAMLDWNMSLLNNGGHLSGIYAIDKDVHLSQGEFERTKQQLNNEHGGKNKVGKWALADGGGKFSSASVNVKDMDWTEGKLQVMKDICIGLGVDPIIIGFNEQSTYNNKNEALKSLYTNKVIPLMRELADILGPFLLLQQGEFLDVKYDKIPILQEDIKQLTETLNSNTSMEVNEKRVKQGLKEVKGGNVIVGNCAYAIIDGKVWLPVNMAPADDEPQDNNSAKPNSSNKDETNKTDSQNKSFFY